MARGNTEKNVGTNYCLSSLETHEIEAAKSHLFTPTPVPFSSFRDSDALQFWAVLEHG